MLKRLVFAFLFILISLFLLKNQITKLSLCWHLSNELAGTCKIEKAVISLKDIKIHNLDCKNDGIDANLKNARINFNFPKLLRPSASEIILKEATVKINNITHLRKDIQRIVTGIVKNKKPTDTGGAAALRLSLDVQDAQISSNDSSGPIFDLDFSFKGILGSKTILAIKHMDIKRFNLKAGVLTIDDLKLTKQEEEIYLLEIPRLKVKEKAIENLRIPLKVEDQSVFIEETHNQFFGQDGNIKGALAFPDYRKLCLNLDMANFSFRRLISIVRPDEDITLGGMFNGQINTCLRGANLGEVKVKLSNDRGGSIDIKKETDLTFLKKYLDEASYHAVIDNFKNYKYNEGKIQLSRHNSSLEVDLQFDSQDMGKRNITINFHNIFGGEK